MSSEQDELTFLGDAKKLVAEFKQNLPQKVDPASLTLNSKLPFKAMSLREVLLYRMTELTEEAYRLYEAKKNVAAILLTRSALETAAMLYWLHMEISGVVDRSETGSIDQYLMKALFGSKDGKGPVEAHNVLTAIQHLDRKHEKFRTYYDTLSEYAHPNWCGTSGPYSEIDMEKVVLNLGENIRAIPTLTGLVPLVASLEVFKHYYNDIAELMPKFIHVCDEQIDKNSTT